MKLRRATPSATRHCARLCGRAALLAVLLAAPALAQEKIGSNRSEGPPREGTPVVKLIETSRVVADWGRQNKDPLALIVAAQMRQQVALSAARRTPEGAPVDKVKDDPDLFVRSILAEAEFFANGDPVVTAMIADVKGSATKGRQKGPAYNVASLGGGGTHWYRDVSFVGGRFAEVYVEGTGKANLDLFVYDENGNLICSDNDQSDVNYCSWTPRWNGNFTMKVVNAGAAASDYTLITN